MIIEFNSEPFGFWSVEISTMLLKKQKHIYLNCNQHLNLLKTAIAYSFGGNNMLFVEFKLFDKC